MLHLAGYYVIGEGMSIPVNSREEAEKIIAEMQKRAATSTKTTRSKYQRHFSHLPVHALRQHSEGCRTVQKKSPREGGLTGAEF